VGFAVSGRDGVLEGPTKGEGSRPISRRGVAPLLTRLNWTFWGPYRRFDIGIALIICAMGAPLITSLGLGDSKSKIESCD
jgi:hypothetical protein